MRFNQLDGKDGSRVQMKRVNAPDRRGGPLRADRQGLRAVTRPLRGHRPRTSSRRCDPKKTKTIEIEDFVDLEDIDPIYFDHPYYLAPGTGGAKPYRLLVDAMRATNKVGVASVVIRSKEQLVALRPIGERRSA